jgi:hypothetical protein
LTFTCWTAQISKPKVMYFYRTCFLLQTYFSISSQIKTSLTYKREDRIKKHKVLDSDHNKYVASSNDKLARESLYNLIVFSFLRNVQLLRNSSNKNYILLPKFIN